MRRSNLSSKRNAQSPSAVTFIAKPSHNAGNNEKNLYNKVFSGKTFLGIGPKGFPAFGCW